jgi:hypothetical protein
MSLANLCLASGVVEFSIFVDHLMNLAYAIKFSRLITRVLECYPLKRYLLVRKRIETVPFLDEIYFEEF